MKISKILVIMFGIFCPVYILITFWRFEFQLDWMPFDWGYNSKIIYYSANYAAPILFCLGWLYFMYLLEHRVTGTIELMGKTSGTISAHYIIFYAVCALVMMISFLIPLFTPLVAVLSFSSLIFKSLTKKVSWSELDEKTKKFVKWVTILINIPILFCAIIVVPELVGLSIDFFLNFWKSWLDPLYYAMKALGVALPIGNFMLLYRNAVKEVRREETGGLMKNFDILLVEMFITSLLIFLSFQGVAFVEFLYYSGIVFWALSFIINFIQGRNTKNSRKGEKSQSPLSLLMFGVFWVATTIFGSENSRFSDTLRYIVVGGAAFVFMIIFLLIFVGHPDLED